MKHYFLVRGFESIHNDYVTFLKSLDLDISESVKEFSHILVVTYKKEYPDIAQKIRFITEAYTKAGFMNISVTYFRGEEDDEHSQAP